MAERVVVRRIGPSSASGSEVATGLSQHGFQVLESDDKMVLAIGEAANLAAALDEISGWQAFPLESVKRPSPTRPGIKRK